MLRFYLGSISIFFAPGWIKYLLFQRTLKKYWKHLIFITESLQNREKFAISQRSLKSESNSRILNISGFYIEVHLRSMQRFQIYENFFGGTKKRTLWFEMSFFSSFLEQIVNLPRKLSFEYLPKNKAKVCRT